MTSFVSVFGSAILPVLSIAATGYTVGRVLSVDADGLATISLYVLLPALVFYSLATSSIAGETVALVIFGSVTLSVVMAGLAEGVGRSLFESEGYIDGLVMTSSFPNTGNYGIPFMAFAFGAAGRSTAVLVVVGQMIATYTLGVYIASRRSAASSHAAVTRVFRLPMLYATVGGLLIQYLDAVPPTDGTVMRTIELTGNAAIPVMLLLLGIELANMGELRAVRDAVPGTALKMLVAPAVAGVLAVLFGLHGTVGRVFLLQGAMPTAISPLALSVEFGHGEQGIATSEYIASAVLLTTLVSVLTISALLLLVTSNAFPI